MDHQKSAEAIVGGLTRHCVFGGGGGPLSGVLPYAAPAHPCAMAALGRPALRGTCTSLCNGISPAVDASLIRTTSAK